MKHPYRIRASKGRRNDNIPDVDLDIGVGDQQPKKKALSVSEPEPKRNRTGYYRQEEKNIQRLIEEKRREDELKKQQEQVKETVKDIWDCDPKVDHPVKKEPINRSLVNSAYSYNPDMNILKEAQKQVATYYLDEQMTEIGHIVNTARTALRADYIKASSDAFKKLAGIDVPEARHEEYELFKQGLRDQLGELGGMYEQVKTNNFMIDEYVQFKQDLQAKRDRLKEEIKMLEDKYQ